MKRTNKVTFRLSDQELARFRRQVPESGLFQETYLRFLIEGFCPNQLPPKELWKETGVFFKGLGNLDELAKIAYHTGNIHCKEIREMHRDISDRLHRIEDAIYCHVPIDLRSIPERDRPKQKYTDERIHVEVGRMIRNNKTILPRLTRQFGTVS